MTKLKDKFWLWGQSPGSHHKSHNELPGNNLMDSRAGCDFFGIGKCCRVTMTTGPFPPFDDEADKIKDLDEVVWSAIGSGGVAQHNDDESDLDEVLRMAKIHPNITGAVLDDFFIGSEFQLKNRDGYARHSVESIQSMRDKLHNFPERKLDLWLVWYTQQLDYPVQEYLDLCDVITMWTWEGRNLKDMEANIKKVLERTPSKRHLAGCYMWNYGERKPLTIDDMKFQCEKYYDWIQKGWIEGIIFCSNCIADIDLDTVEWTRNWITAIGDETII